jgi:hypothetical protein
LERQEHDPHRIWVTTAATAMERQDHRDKAGSKTKAKALQKKGG